MIQQTAALPLPYWALGAGGVRLRFAGDVAALHEKKGGIGGVGTPRGCAFAGGSLLWHLSGM